MLEEEEDRDKSFDFENFEEHEAMEKEKLGSAAGAHTYALVEVLSPPLRLRSAAT